MGCGMSMGGKIFRTRYEVEVDRKAGDSLGIEVAEAPGGKLCIKKVMKGDDDLIEKWNRSNKTETEGPAHFNQVEEGHIIEKVNGDSANDNFLNQTGKIKLVLSRKLVFLTISPNKTWEGFMGAIACTVIFAWFAADFFSRFQWFTCPQTELRPFSSLDCEPPDAFVRKPMLLGFGTYCEAQWHCMAFAMFASFVAPFGGFLASGIKRAYNIKDFGDLIPGHGGFMDRMDCQLIMLFCAHGYYATMVDFHFHERQILSAFGALSDEGKQRIFKTLSGMMAGH